MRVRRFVAIGVLATALLSGVVTMSGATSAAAAGQEKKNATCSLAITGMTCAGCAVSVKMAAKKVDGVVDAKVTYEDGRAEVTYDPARTTPERIAKAITDNSGFKAELQTPKKK